MIHCYRPKVERLPGFKNPDDWEGQLGLKTEKHKAWIARSTVHKGDGTGGAMALKPKQIKQMMKKLFRKRDARLG